MSASQNPITIRALAGTATTNLFDKDVGGSASSISSCSKKAEHGSAVAAAAAAAPVPFKIPYGRTGTRYGRSAGGFDGMLSCPFFY